MPSRTISISEVCLQLDSDSYLRKTVPLGEIIFHKKSYFIKRDNRSQKKNGIFKFQSWLKNQIQLYCNFFVLKSRKVLSGKLVSFGLLKYFFSIRYLLERADDKRCMYYVITYSVLPVASYRFISSIGIHSSFVSDFDIIGTSLTWLEIGDKSSSIWMETSVSKKKWSTIRFLYYK